MKENFSVMRPQIVERFVQRLMEDSQDDGPKVGIQNEGCGSLCQKPREEGRHLTHSLVRSYSP